MSQDLGFGTRSSDGAPQDAAALRLYSDLAPWFPLLTHPDDYAYEARMIALRIWAGCAHPPRTVLELGSGGGNNASHLKRHFALTLVDLSPDMLAVSRTLNPECEHLQGDMRSLRLGRQFDGVLIHDAIMYLCEEDDLRAAIETAYAHCKPGGAAVFVPDCVRETFEPRSSQGGHDGPDRGLRYVEWTWDPDPEDSQYLADFAYLLHEPDGGMRVLGERHVFGLFARADWLRLIAEAGFEASVAADDYGRDVFVGARGPD